MWLDNLVIQLSRSHVLRCNAMFFLSLKSEIDEARRHKSLHCMCRCFSYILTCNDHATICIHLNIYLHKHTIITIYYTSFKSWYKKYIYVQRYLLFYIAEQKNTRQSFLRVCLYWFCCCWHFQNKSVFFFFHTFSK